MRACDSQKYHKHTAHGTWYLANLCNTRKLILRCRDVKWPTTVSECVCVFDFVCARSSCTQQPVCPLPVCPSPFVLVLAHTMMMYLLFEALSSPTNGFTCHHSNQALINKKRARMRIHALETRRQLVFFVNNITRLTPSRAEPEGDAQRSIHLTDS